MDVKGLAWVAGALLDPTPALVMGIRVTNCHGTQSQVLHICSVQVPFPPLRDPELTRAVFSGILATPSQTGGKPGTVAPGATLQYHTKAG